MINLIRGVSGLCQLFVLSPIFYFLSYKILASIQSTDFMWFLFWAYLPTHLGLLSVSVVASLYEAKP